MDADASLIEPPGWYQPGDQPLRLRCRVLTTHAEPGTREISDLEALGDVVIEGLTQGSGDKPGRAEADRFRWSPAMEHGLLAMPEDP